MGVLSAITSVVLTQNANMWPSFNTDHCSMSSYLHGGVVLGVRWSSDVCCTSGHE